MPTIALLISRRVPHAKPIRTRSSPANGNAEAITRASGANAVSWSSGRRACASTSA